MPDRVARNRNHTHLLLGQGYLQLLEILADSPAELAQVRAESIDACADFEWITPYGRGPRFASQNRTLAITNRRLKELLLGALSKRANVHLHYGKTARFARKASSRTGTMPSLIVIAGERIFEDALVIDCTAQGPDANRVFPDLKPSVFDSHMSYTSFWLRPSSETRPDWKCLVHESTPLNTRSCICTTEGDLIQMTFARPFDQAPERNLEALVEFASAMGNPQVLGLLQRGEIVSPIEQLKHVGKNSVYGREEILARSSDNYFPAGDALARFNPYFGLGMTFAFLCANQLARALAMPKTEGQRKAAYLRAAYAFIDENRSLIQRIERRWAPSPERRATPRKRKWSHAYLDFLWRQAVVEGHRAYYLLFLRIFHRLESPSALLGLGVMLRAFADRWVPTRRMTPRLETSAGGAQDKASYAFKVAN